MSERSSSEELTVTFTAAGSADEYVVKLAAEELAFSCQLAVYWHRLSAQCRNRGRMTTCHRPSTTSVSTSSVGLCVT